MSYLLDHNLLYVTGKGGVGRTTVAAALGLAAARAGRRTIVCEVGAQERLATLFGRDGTGGAETEMDEGLWAMSVDPPRAMVEWLRTQLPGPVVKLLADNNAFSYFAAAAPGAKELVTMAKVWELAQTKRWKKGASGYDLVIVDAPASGHGIGMLRAPRTFHDIARVGPIAKQSRQVRDFLADERRTAYVAVALAEEMPVTETLELREALERDLEVDLDAVVVNGVLPRRFSAQDRERLEAAADDGQRPAAQAALRAAMTEHGRSRGQQRQLGRLRRGAGDASVLTLPYLFQRELDRPAIDRLATELGRKLDGAR
jgi:anion-transporting  ArsA/GET3 family ATPase